MVWLGQQEVSTDWSSSLCMRHCCQSICGHCYLLVCVMAADRGCVCVCVYVCVCVCVCDCVCGGIYVNHHEQHFYFLITILILRLASDFMFF